MLVTVGLLALASTSAFLTFEHAASGRAERAATLAGSRLEILRAEGCTPSQGTETVDGLTVAWSATMAARTGQAVVRISWVERGSRVVHRYDSAFPC